MATGHAPVIGDFVVRAANVASDVTRRLEAAPCCPNSTDGVWGSRSGPARCRKRRGSQRGQQGGRASGVEAVQRGDGVVQAWPPSPAAARAARRPRPRRSSRRGRRNTVAPGVVGGRHLELDAADGLRPSPSASIAPVPAMNRPPVRSPGVSLSTTPSENISPADGPPTSPRSIRMSPVRGRRRPAARRAGPGRGRARRPASTCASAAAAVAGEGHRDAAARAGAGSELVTASRAATGVPLTATSRRPTASCRAAGESGDDARRRRPPIGQPQLASRRRLGVRSRRW